MPQMCQWTAVTQWVNMSKRSMQWHPLSSHHIREQSAAVSKTILKNSSRVIHTRTRFFLTWIIKRNILLNKLVPFSCISFPSKVISAQIEGMMSECHIDTTRNVDRITTSSSKKRFGTLRTDIGAYSENATSILIDQMIWWSALISASTHNKFSLVFGTQN